MGSPYIYMVPVPLDDEPILVEAECGHISCSPYADITGELHTCVLKEVEDGILHDLIEEGCQLACHVK